MRKLLLLLCAVALMIASCDGGDDDNGMPPAALESLGGTPSPVDAAPTPGSFSPPLATGTPLPPVPVTPPELAACPIANPAICGFALELQAALNEGDLQAITSRLAPRTFRCDSVFFAVDERIGCETGAGQSDPAVYNYAYGSDCCVTAPANFAPALEEFVTEAEQEPGDWRVYAMIQGDTFFGGNPSVVLAHGTGPEAQILDFGTVIVNSEARTSGIIRGCLGCIFVPQGATLLPWP